MFSRFGDDSWKGIAILKLMHSIRFPYPIKINQITPNAVLF